MAADRWASEPELGLRWIAAHRRLVRLVCLVVDAALLSWVLVRASNGADWWSLLPLVALYGGLTWQFGWYYPRRFDKWKDAHEGAAGPKRP